MSIKKVPLQDLELWPDEVICFSAYTDTRNPVQQRRTYVNGEKLQAENAKLRELVHKQDALTKAVHAYWAGSERSLDEFNAMMDANAQVLALMRELGIEVPE